MRVLYRLANDRSSMPACSSFAVARSRMGSDWYSTKHAADAPKACCIPENPRGGLEAGSYDPCQPQIRIPRKVVKGGSHLCAPSYCRRYRPAARHAQPVDTSMSHVGFRYIIREGDGP